MPDAGLQPVEPLRSPGLQYHAKARKWQGIPGIERAANGRLWAAWYTGGRTEEVDNHLVLVTSESEGAPWSEPVLVVDPPGLVRVADPVLWHDPRGRLWLFWMQTECRGRKVFDGRGGVWAICTEDSGSVDPVWSAPRRIANGVMMNKPTVLATGEWLLPTAVWSHGRPYHYSLPQESYSNVTLSRDEGKTFEFLSSADVPNRHCDEAMIVERRDGSLWMLVRRRDGIGEAVSTDRGKTWTASPGAIFPGPNSRFHIRRLGSGRLLLIYHHHLTGRSHLVAMLSGDDGATWPHRLLLDERQDVSYPDAVETPDGRIHVIYDRRRVGEGEILLQTITEAAILEGTAPGHKSGRLEVISRVERPKIGSRLELFVDELLVDQKKNVTLRLHSPERREVAFVADHPWEGTLCGYATVFRDGDRLRMYYKSGDTRPPCATRENRFTHTIWICYAESRDGISWERPELGLFEYEGSKANNIVFCGIGEERKGVHGFTPFLDTNPACPPEERYKALGGIGENALLGDLYAMVSGDGIHWRLLQEEPILRQREHGAFDSQSVAFWDEERKEYRVYFRDYLNRDLPSRLRTIKTARSADFRYWDDLRLIELPGSIAEPLYTNQALPYYRAPHIILGFPTRYTQRPWSPAIEALPETEHRRWRMDVFFERYGAALTDGVLIASRDRNCFRKWDDAFLRPGPQQTGNWTYGDNYQAVGLFETPSPLAGAPDEISFLATENAARLPGVGFRRFSLRKDGFVSIRAPRAGGEVTLIPFRFSGSRLVLNLSTSAAGSIRVELQDFSGKTFQGYTAEECIEVIGDDLERTVRWERHGTDVSSLAGELIRMRFVMADADLFAFRFLP